MRPEGTMGWGNLPIFGLTLLALSSVVLCSASAWSDEIDVQARSWAATCAPCHGTAGASRGPLPVLAGRPAEELYGLLLEYKSDKRQATVMHQHAKGWADGQLRRIAQYFAAQQP